MTDPNQIRINELARELEVKAKVIIDYLPEAGVTEKKTHSSSIDVAAAVRVREHFRALADAESAAEEKAASDKAAKDAAARAARMKPAAVAAPPPPPQVAPTPSAPVVPEFHRGRRDRAQRHRGRFDYRRSGTPPPARSGADRRITNVVPANRSDGLCGEGHERSCSD